jgi:phenylalanyl-tRNA synthetase beta chain
MRVPVDALAEMLGELPSVDELVATLDGLGLPVDAVLELPGAPAGVLVADLIEVRPHPDADGLTVVRVRAGEREAEVVCGAPNARVGLRSAWVPPGTALPALGETIEARDVRGVRSEGMLASPRELGLFDHQGGLIVLGDDVAPGTELADAWGPGTVLELEITPNRADATALLGVARDLAAKLRLTLRDPSLAADLDLGDPDVHDGLHVEVADPERCPRFTLRRIEGVRVAPSPVWLQRRVAAFGLRPRNNVVDVTNLVTFELGQPSHAYDVRALEGGVLQVRRARAEERLVTLGDDELTLDPDDLVIATPERRAHDTASVAAAADAGSRAVGLAGVIGGAGDSVRDDTSDVALEVAHFDPVGVRRTARRHKLHTDAHYRFERGVDPELPERASARIAALLAQVAGGTPHTGVTIVGTAREAPTIDFRPSRVAWLTTLEVDVDEQRAMLERLGCSVSVAGPDAWRVAPPSWRVDLGIEEDLIEEVARLHGFEHIAASVPNLTFVPPAGDPTHRALRDALVENGFLETIGYAFTGAAELAAARAPAASVVLAEPQGLERAVLRTALYPGLLAAARLNHAERDLALFEVGRVFGADERERVALLLRGRRLVAPWRAGLEVDFYVAKGVLEQLAERFGAALELRPAVVDHLHPHASAEVSWDGRAVGHLGRVHPEVAAAFELGETYVAELELPLTPRAPALAPLPRQPFAERDLAVVVPHGVTFAELRGALAAVAGPWLISLEPFDVYEGEQVGEGKRSLALRFRFRHEERSLADAEVEACMKEVMQAARAAGYTLRT